MLNLVSEQTATVIILMRKFDSNKKASRTNGTAALFSNQTISDQGTVGNRLLREDHIVTEVVRKTCQRVADC